MPWHDLRIGSHGQVSVGCSWTRVHPTGCSSSGQCRVLIVRVFREVRLVLMVFVQKKSGGFLNAPHAKLIEDSISFSGFFLGIRLDLRIFTNLVPEHPEHPMALDFLAIDQICQTIALRSEIIAQKRSEISSIN